jgi:hypothetical protein
VEAAGNGTLTYQWQKGGANIPGATSADYNIASAQASDAGNYVVIVSNGSTSTPSNQVALTVNLANSAIRTGRKLQFDPVAMRFVNDEEANRLAEQPMRAPWHL